MKRPQLIVEQIAYVKSVAEGRKVCELASKRFNYKFDIFEYECSDPDFRTAVAIVTSKPTQNFHFERVQLYVRGVTDALRA